MPLTTVPVRERGTDPEPLRVGGDVALAAGNGELVVVDLATGLGTARALAAIVGSESVELLALAYDPWAEQAVLAFRRCETCEVLLRFADVEAP